MVFGGILVVIFDDWGTIETSYYQRINSMSTNTLPSHIHKRLANGLNVILAPLQTKSVTVLAMVGTGSRFETAKTSGISHFLEHMVFKGTKNYPSARELSGAVDSVGAEFNAFTSKEYTGYYVKAAGEHVHLALDVVSDMLLTPILGTEEMEREKGVIVEEIHMYEDTPARHIGDLFERMMFAGSALGRDIIGTEKTVRSFSRETFSTHLEQWYGLSNVVLAVAGDDSVVTNELLTQISQLFEKQHSKREHKETPEIIQKIRGNSLTTGKRIHVEYKDTQQAHFVMAFEGLQRKDPDQYAATILSTLLGGNMSSRLFTEVREKRGLCYYVRADDDSYHDVGIFGASAGVDPSRVEEAVKVVREQLHLVTEESGASAITEEEVVKAKNHAIGSTILHMEDSMSIAQFYAGRKLLRGEIIEPEDELNRLRDVTFDDVRRVAKRLCNQEKIYFSIIGPYKDEGLFEKNLSL